MRVWVFQPYGASTNGELLEFAWAADWGELLEQVNAGRMLFGVRERDGRRVAVNPRFVIRFEEVYRP